MNKLLQKVAKIFLGLSMAAGVGVAIGSNRKAGSVSAADSGLSPSDGVFIIDFYDSTKLSSTSGTGLTNNNYSGFVKVATGLTKTNVVTSVSVTGTVRYGMNGGLTCGTGTAASESTHYVTFNIGNDYAVNKCTVYATTYDSGRWKLNGSAAGSGSLGSKGATFANVTSPLVWSNLGGVTALTFKKDNGSGGNQKRLTIYTIVCEYTASSNEEETSVSLNVGKSTLTAVNDTTTITATVKDSSNITISNATVSFSVLPETGVVSLSGSGNSRTVTAVADGTARITVSYGGLTGTYQSSSSTTNITVETPETFPDGTPGDATFTSDSKVIVNSVEYDAVKLGASGKGGSATATIPVNSIAMTFRAAAWKDKSPTLSISGVSNVTPSGADSYSPTSDTGMTGNSPFTLAGSKKTYLHTINFTKTTASTTVTFTSASERVVIWDIKYYIDNTTKYTVSFSANNASYSGSVPTPITQSSFGAAITLPAALSCTGYTWLGWNTSSSGGESTRKAAGSSYTPLSDHTLYGEWQINSYSVTGTITNGSLSNTSNVNHGSALNTVLQPSTHYHLPASLTSVTMGGSTLVAGTGYTYNNSTGAISISSVTGVVVITASCDEDAKYTVTYVKGDHGSGSDYVVSDVYTGSYTLVSVVTAGFTADSGYSFKKWSVGGVEYNPGDTITLSDNTTITAVWAQVVTLTYDKNGGTGTNISSEVGKGSTVTVADNEFTAPSGMEFVKWTTNQDGSGTSYVKDDTFTINSNTTLYAQWAPVLDITISNFTEITTSYTTVFTHAYTVATYNSTTTMNVKAYGVYNNSNGIQMNSGKGTYIKNTDSLPTGAYITKIICEWTATGKNSPTIYVSKDAEASTSSTSLGTGSNTVTTQTFTIENASTNKYNHFYFDGTTVTGACYLTHLKICYDFNDEVQSIAVNATQAQLTFNVGDTFTFAGSVTPTRLITGTGSSTTENLTFKLGGTAITAGSYTFTKADDGKTLTVIYTENGKSVEANASYNVVVDYTYVESVEINVATSELGKVDSFTFGARVLPSTAQQDVVWSVVKKSGDISSGFSIDSSTGELTVNADAGGVLTITATTVGEDENGDTLSDSLDVMVTGDPVVVVNSALAGYSGKNENLAYSFSNFTGTLSVVSSDTAKVTVGTPSATTGGSGSGTVQVNFVAAGSSTLSFMDDSTVINTCVVTVTASVVSSVSWSNSSDMTVYSGSTALNAAKITEWAPQYTMNNSDSGSITSGYSIQLNGSAYTLGTALQAGTYTVTLTYGGQTTASSNPTVTVVQSLASITGVGEYSWEAVSGDQGTIAAAGESGDFIIGGQTWTIERDNTATTNLTSGAIQIGANGNPTNFSLTTNFGANAVITSITVQCASYNGNSSATTGLHDISISVGGTSYYSGATPRWASNSTGPVSGTGSSKGDVVIEYTANSGARAAYLKSIVVEYSSDIANNTSHIEAQAKVVEFAQYMNEQMNGTNVCNGTFANLGTAWGNVSTKYNNLFGSGSSLDSSELAYAKDMLANASANWNELHDSDEQYCLERAMKTYEWCISHYSSEVCNPFMSGVRTVSAPHISPLINIVGEKANTVAIIVIISMVSVTAIGGYFFLRKRKENN